MKPKRINRHEENFELKLANGKTGSFVSGYKMWEFAQKNSSSFDTRFDDKNGPFLSDFFEQLRKKK
jgi:hypothetical protein